MSESELGVHIASLRHAMVEALRAAPALIRSAAGDAELPESFIGRPSTPETRAAYKQAVSDLIRKLYAEGGYVLDLHDNQPILTFEEVQIYVELTPHTLKSVAVRKRPGMWLAGDLAKAAPAPPARTVPPPTD